MTSGLSFIRGIICSYLTYQLFSSIQAFNIIKASLNLINNAIILMKAP